MKVASTDGAEFYVELHGSGEPFVLIAGTGCDHKFWRRQVAEYAKEYQVVLMDMRGAGQSTVTHDPAKYTSEMLADDVAGVLETLELGPAHIAGHSLGSCIAQQIALRHPDRARSLQLHATWAYADAWLQSAFIGSTRYPLELGDKRQTVRTVLMWMLSPEYLETRQPADVSEMVTDCLIKNPHMQANAGMLGHLNADGVHDTRRMLQGVTVPTLVTAGEIDLLIPARYGREVHELVPGSAFHLFEGPHSSHGFNWEMADEFNRVTLEHLRSI